MVGLRIDPEPEVFASLNSADISGGTLIAHRPALIIDTSDLDFVESAADFDELLRAIGQAKAGTRYYQPLTRT